jgi:predicted nuclease of predicted toxin-antitoxin system
VKFKLDENMPESLAHFLTQSDHDVETASGERLAGAKDPEIVQAATREGRVLMTFDLDFADIRMYPPGKHAGVVVFRLKDQRRRTLRQPVRHLLDETDIEKLRGSLAIVEAARVRYRCPKK